MYMQPCKSRRPSYSQYDCPLVYRSRGISWHSQAYGLSDVSVIMFLATSCCCYDRHEQLLGNTEYSYSVGGKRIVLPPESKNPALRSRSLLTHEDNVAMINSRTSMVDMITWQTPSTTIRNSRILDIDEAAVESPRTMRRAHKTSTMSHNIVVKVC